MQNMQLDSPLTLGMKITCAVTPSRFGDKVVRLRTAVFVVDIAREQRGGKGEGGGRGKGESFTLTELY